jgi:hypothetical protein
LVAPIRNVFSLCLIQGKSSRKYVIRGQVFGHRHRKRVQIFASLAR